MALNPGIPYIGGKSRLAKWIISHFPENYKKMSYVEPFGGGGWVLFANYS
jgi:DNA adenine methylase